MSAYDDGWPGIGEVTDLPGWSDRWPADPHYFGRLTFIEIRRDFRGEIIGSGLFMPKPARHPCPSLRPEPQTDVR